MPDKIAMIGLIHILDCIFILGQIDNLTKWKCCIDLLGNRHPPQAALWIIRIHDQDFTVKYHIFDINFYFVWSI